MTRKANEIADLVEETITRFRVLDADEKKWQQVEAGTFDFTQVIPKEVGVTPVPAISRGLTEMVSLQKAVLSVPMRPVVHLSKSGTRADEERDAMEVFFDYARYRMDPSGFHRRRRRDHIVRSRFGVDILSINPVTGKEDEDYWRYNLHTPDPKAIGPIERDGKLETVVLEEEIAALDLADYADGYKGKTKKDAGDFLKRTFPNLRLSDGRTVGETEDFNGKRLKRCVVYDSDRIYQYVNDTGVADSAQRYVEVNEEVNTFGAPPVVIYPGIYRPHTDIKERYEGLMWPVARAYYNWELINSIALTVFANPRYAEQLDKDIAGQLLDSLAGAVSSGNTEQLSSTVKRMQLPERDKSGRVGASIAFGNVTDITPKLDSAFSIALQYFREELDEVRQQWQSVFPSPEVVERGTSAGIFAAIEAGHRRAEEPQSVVIAGEARLFTLIAHDIAHAYKRDIRFRVYDDVAPSMAKEIESGSEFKVTPDMMAQFPVKARVGLEPVPDTKAQQAAAVSMEVEAQAAVGVKNAKRVYEAMGITNVSERLEEDAALQNAAMLGPGFMALAMEDELVQLALEEGRDSALLKSLFLPQLDTGGGGPGGGEGVNTGYRYNAPATPQAGNANGSTPR